MSADELMAVHEAVVEAARRGVAVSFGDGTDGFGGDGDDVGGDGDRPELPAYDDDAAWAGRTVDGRWLAMQLMGSDAQVHPRGLVLRGARILGGLDLEGAELAHLLRLVHCQLGEHVVVLREARTRTVELSGCHCGGVDADGAQVGGWLRLRGATVAGPLRLIDAHVAASVVCDNTSIEAPPGVTAVHASRVRVGGSVAFGAGFEAVGEVRLSRATIGGALIATGATLRNPGGSSSGVDAGGAEETVRLVRRFRQQPYAALRVNGAEVSGSISLGHGFMAEGEVHMVGVRVGGDLACAEARFESPGGDALNLDSAHIGGGLFLQRSVAVGRVRLVNSEIGGDLRGGGARIDHPSDIALYASRANITGNVFLDDGFVTHGQVRLSGASIGGRLRCGSASMSDPNPGGAALDADAARIGGEVHLDRGFAAVGQVRFASATIGAGFDCRGARIERGEATGPAVDLRGARIATNALFMDCNVHGTVRFTGATVAGDVNCRRARMVSPDHNALHGSGAQVGGTIFLSGGFVAEGEVRLLGISIARDLVATDSRITSTGQRAVGLTRARITGDVLLGRGFVAAGEVGIARAVIGGNLDCVGGTFAGHDRVAIDASDVQVSGAVLLGDTSSVTGELRVAGATVGGNLDLGRAAVANPDEGWAVNATNARVTGGVYVGGPVVGGVRLKGVTVGGDVDCGGAHLVAANDDVALVVDRAQVAGSLLLNRGFEAEGGIVRIRSSTIGGHASCWAGRFSNPEGTALAFSGSRVAGDLVLTGARRSGVRDSDERSDTGFRAEGTTRLPGTAIDGDLVCTGGSFVGVGDEPALFAAGARITGTLYLDGGFHAQGAVVLQGASAATLQDDSASWPDRIDLDGFRYEHLACVRADRRWRARRHWLRRQIRPSGHGYVQLANVYRAAGDEVYARRILSERHNALLRPPPHWREQLPSGPHGVAWRAWRWVLRLTIGHGFSPGRSLLIAVPLLVGLALWLTHARADDMLLPTDETAATSAADAADGDGAPRASRCDDSYPCVQPLVYALDNLVPIVDLGQRSRWTPDQSQRGASWVDDGRWLATATWTTSAIGWVLATLVAASFTQIVRRE